jgi:hypothetical protein
MIGRFLLAAIAGLVVWKYRDSLREYVKSNEGPAREKVDGLLQTVQLRSETLLDQAKEQLSSRLGSVREKVRAGALGVGRVGEDPPSSSYDPRYPRAPSQHPQPTE